MEHLETARGMPPPPFAYLQRWFGLNPYTPFCAKQTLSPGTCFPESFCLQDTFGETGDISDLLSVTATKSEPEVSTWLSRTPLAIPAELDSGELGKREGLCSSTLHFSGDQG